METKEINEENIRVLAKLGVDTKDIANIYLEITEKGKDISKDVYINNLTGMIKFFQTRNNNIEDEINEAIYKEDVLAMVKKNKKLVSLDVNKKIKPICDKIDSYYFMNTGYTNKLIKNNPNIFNINKVDLDIYAAVLSNFAINVDGNVINLYEYIIKKKSDFLNQDVQKVYERLMYISKNNNTKLITLNDINEIEVGNSFNDEDLSKKYKLPKYIGESIEDYTKKVLNSME